MASRGALMFFDLFYLKYIRLSQNRNCKQLPVRKKPFNWFLQNNYWNKSNSVLGYNLSQNSLKYQFSFLTNLSTYQTITIPHFQYSNKITDKVCPLLIVSIVLPQHIKLLLIIRQYI